ncbi:hypothetical protein [Mycobacterium sp. 050134]|uniref:hypothetical protein n=1 Tax=Mycobacterium sp. 050134 TaxID=3096111 RepID=UPI002ED81C9A
MTTDKVVGLADAGTAGVHSAAAAPRPPRASTSTTPTPRRPATGIRGRHPAAPWQDQLTAILKQYTRQQVIQLAVSLSLSPAMAAVVPAVGAIGVTAGAGARPA